MLTSCKKLIMLLSFAITNLQAKFLTLSSYLQTGPTLNFNFVPFQISESGDVTSWQSENTGGGDDNKQ